MLKRVFQLLMKNMRLWLYMSPVPPVFHTVVTMSIGLKNKTKVSTWSLTSLVEVNGFAPCSFEYFGPCPKWISPEAKYFWKILSFYVKDSLLWLIVGLRFRCVISLTPSCLINCEGFNRFGGQKIKIEFWPCQCFPTVRQPGDKPKLCWHEISRL